MPKRQRDKPSAAAAPLANITILRMKIIAQGVGYDVTGMMGCTIDEPHRARALFGLTRGFVIVDINGEAETHTWYRLKAAALYAWDELCDRVRQDKLSKEVNA